MTRRTPTLPRTLGKRIKRREDKALLTGRGRYVADIGLEEALHMAFVRSPYAHARIKSIQADEARSMSGVEDILSGRDIHTELVRPLPAELESDIGEFTMMRDPEAYPFADERARYVGEPIAAVLARDPYIAADAAGAVQVDYEPLTPVMDPGEAANATHESIYQGHSNRAFDWEVSSGDLERVIGEAHIVVEVPFRIQRLLPNAMEPRAVAASFDSATSSWTLWSSTQIPHLLRNELAAILGVPRESIRVIAPEVGGGFGAKSNVYPEDIAALVASRRLNRAVRWTATRSEDLASTSHGRDQINTLRLAANEDGRIEAADLQLMYDSGAYYTRSGGPGIATLTGMMMTGVYDIPHARCRAVGVFTNKVPNEPYRGAGRPEAAYMIERAVDVLASRLGIDATEIRRRNLIPPESFPYTTPVGTVYDTGEYARALDRCLKKIGYKSLRREQASRRASGGKPLGIGIACYVEICGFGPWEAGSVDINGEGKVRVLSGTSPHGQGHQTAWAQIASDVLQIPSRDITVVHGDTGIVPRGIGTFGSRSAPVGGAAVFNNAELVVEGAKRIAAHLLEAAPEDIRLSAGKFHVTGVDWRALGWKELAEAAHDPTLPDELKGQLSSDDDFRPSGETFPFGAHGCAVEIDPETGEVAIVRFVSVDDCGEVINPLLADGQIHGGIAQGIGQALYEEAVYDESGSLITGSLVEYALPKADMLPSFETHRTVTPTSLNPLGAKGIGEAATIGSTPAVVNAVVDALAPWGVTHLDTPLRPEKIWRIVRREKN